MFFLKYFIIVCVNSIESQQSSVPSLSKYARVSNKQTTKLTISATTESFTPDDGSYTGGDDVTSGSHRSSTSASATDGATDDASLSLRRRLAGR